MFVMCPKGKETWEQFPSIKRQNNEISSVELPIHHYKVTSKLNVKILLINITRRKVHE